MSREEQTHTVKCPTCGVAVEWTEAQRWRPFCSERCRLIDLGKWASGQYVITSPVQDISDLLEHPYFKDGEDD